MSSGLGNSLACEGSGVFYSYAASRFSSSLLEQPLATNSSASLASSRPLANFTLVLVGLAMQEILIAIFNLMQTKMRLRRPWRFMVLASYLLILPFLHICDLFDAILPAALIGWKRHTLVMGTAATLTSIGYYLLFLLLLGMDTTTIRLLGRSLHLNARPSLSNSSFIAEAAEAGTAGLGGLSMHILSSFEAMASSIWHMMSAAQIVIRHMLIHPVSSCVLIGWAWTIAETVS